MSSQTIGVAALLALFLLIRFFNSTDTPKIKGLPEVPGVPVFGNLLQLGTDHARVAQKWAVRYGPVFQTRLGNRVGPIPFHEWMGTRELITSVPESRIRQLV